MSELLLPAGYPRVTPYLIVNNALGFVQFMKAVFGAEEREMHFREDSETLMHGELRIGDSPIMVAEATEDWKAENAGMFIYVANADDTYQKAIDNNATTRMPLSNQSYGRTCGVLDPWGNTWWITQHLG